ncbi:hypothetical protein [Streptomyces coerulescens]|uniref:Carboxypeptidase regulatory-like domain-containing protein n=1 Tax=Streptomyces coerulescens TaxID=29304 RepID=A0ABW0CYV9_STRCD
MSRPATGSQGPFLAAAPLSRTHRLALGLEVIDALRDEPADVRVAVENQPPPHRVPALTSLASTVLYDPGIQLPHLPRGRRAGRFRLLFDERTAPPVHLRVYDTARRYVPRRLEVPFAPLATVLAEERSGARPASRARRIALFAGAAYGPQGNATGLRGRVEDADGVPVRWARVTARHPRQGDVLGRAHGDDRGEFLLVLGAPPELATPRDFTVQVLLDFAATTRPGGSAGTDTDPLAGLPLERLPPTGSPDSVSDGTGLPPTYSVRVTVAASLRLGRLVSPDAPFTLPEPE